MKQGFRYLAEQEQLIKARVRAQESYQENSEPAKAKYTRTKGKRMVDTHTRKTFWVENELLKEFSKIAKSQGKGFEKKVINEALQQIVDDLSELSKDGKR